MHACVLGWRQQPSTFRFNLTTLPIMISITHGHQYKAVVGIIVVVLKHSSVKGISPWWVAESAPVLIVRAQPAFVRIHQDFTRTVLRGGKPQIVKDVRAHLGRDLGLDEFKYWTAVVRRRRTPRHALHAVPSKTAPHALPHGAVHQGGATPSWAA